jgi:beta-phosphoglucomutase
MSGAGGGEPESRPVDGSSGREPAGRLFIDGSTRAVLWDLDGTLVDSEEQHWQAWRKTMSGRGITISREQFEATFGQRNDAILGAWLGPDTDPATVRELGDVKEARYRELVAADGIEPLPGAAEWIAALGAGGWRQAVASSAPRLNVEVVLHALDLQDRLATIVAAEDVRFGKPEPEVFLTAARRLAAPPSCCVVVEDAVAGVEAARRARMACIGIGPPDFAPADIVVADLTRLAADAFDRLLSRSG